MGPQGIFIPKLLGTVPISVTTAPIVEGKDRPYDDSESSDGLIAYKYRGNDIQHRENVGLRIAMRERIPLIYFFGLVPGSYAAAYPTYIVGDSPESLTFTLAVDEGARSELVPGSVADDEQRGRRAYVTATVQRRLHQQGFRERVLAAYQSCCSVCRLKHPQLLDAAHILPDSHPDGAPVVPNGLALCKIHHAAFDTFIMGITPDLKIEIRSDILLEQDGPMLKHGLQELHGSSLLVLPRSVAQKPRREFLAERYERFRRVG